jgi:Winged helix DNA-binding domain
MNADWIFGTDRPVVQLAIDAEVRRVLARWLDEDLLRFTVADTDADGWPAGSQPIGGEPIVVRLGARQLIELAEKTWLLLEQLTTRAPVIAIVDAETVEFLPRFFDVERVEFVVWPCDKGAFMSAVQQIASPSLRERAEAGTINPGALREEIDRIAKALSALVEGSAPQPRSATAVRSKSESARLIRGIIRRRRARAQFFPADLFADPAWDILLDLAAARLEGTRVSISSLCIAAAVPTTTALRWIKGMTSAGILERESDPEDGRRSFVRLSGRFAAAMEAYLTLIDEGVV